MNLQGRHFLLVVTAALGQTLPCAHRSGTTASPQIAAAVLQCDIDRVGPIPDIKGSFQCKGDRGNLVHRFRSSHLVAAHAFAETRKAKAY